MRFADLDAVTVDAHGTIVDLLDPVPALCRALAGHGVDADPGAVTRAFHAEIAYYRPRGSQGRAAESLRRLREECVAVFLGDLGADLDAAAFTDPYIATFVFEALEGTFEGLRSLRARGLAIAVVSNWDVSLHEELDRLGIAPLVDLVVTSADAGVEKPDPGILLAALERLGVAPARALHIGDRDEDEQAARAAGMHFAPAPFAAAVAGLAA
jgi:FMN phosphatase YigB (HAD superfamily)